MWISVSNRIARVLRATPDERAWLREYLSFPDPNARFKGKTEEEGVRHLYEEVTATFHAGFARLVVKEGARVGHKVEIVDKRVAPCARDAEADLAWLRDYQRAGVECCITKTRGILQHATGAGKTEIVIGLTRVLPTSWLFLAPSLSLVNNAADRFIKRNLEHGVDLGEPGRIGEGKWTEGEHLTCATYQSIQRSLNSDRCQRLLARVGGLVADECHVVPAITFMEATKACNAYYRIGLSATPLDRMTMDSSLGIAVLGPIIHKVTPAELVATGDISRARVRFSTVHHPFPDGFTYPEVYQELVVNSKVRNALLVNLAKKAEKPGLLFVRNIDHGRWLKDLLWQAGVKAEFVWGTHSAQQIKDHLAALVRGDVEIIVTSAVLKQGIDVPSLRTIILGGGGKSVIDALQKLGRGSRIERDHQGKVVKDQFTVLDVFDRGNEWLEKHSKDRKRAFIQEGYEVVVEAEQPRAFATRKAAAT